MNSQNPNFRSNRQLDWMYAERLKKLRVLYLVIGLCSIPFMVIVILVAGLLPSNVGDFLGMFVPPVCIVVCLIFICLALNCEHKIAKISYFPTPLLKGAKDNSGFAIASFGLSLIPVLFWTYCLIMSPVVPKQSEDSLGWIVMLYYIYGGLAVTILSVVFAILGIRSRKRVFAIIALFSKPLIIFALVIRAIVSAYF